MAFFMGTAAYKSKRKWLVNTNKFNASTSVVLKAVQILVGFLFINKVKQ